MDNTLTLLNVSNVSKINILIGTSPPCSSQSQRAETGSAPPLSSEPRSSEANLCRTSYLTWGGWERLPASLCTVLRGNRLFMGPLLLLLEVALFCPVIVFYPTRSHPNALFTISRNSQESWSTTDSHFSCGPSEVTQWFPVVEHHRD